jgi:hypothetical protein
MAVDKTKCGLTFKHPRVSRDHQESALRDAGASWIVHVGIDCPSWRAVVDNCEPGDVVYVYACAMIPAPVKKDGTGLAAQWTQFNTQMAIRRATYVEVLTGRSSKHLKSRNELIAETQKWLAHHGKRIPLKTTPGRPKVKWPNDEVRKSASKLWTSKNVPSDAAAKRAIVEQWADLVDHKGKPLVTDRLIMSLGPSGRNRR